MIYGLLAAAGWGISTIAAANAARRIGAPAALLASQALGAVVIAVMLLVLRPPLGALLHNLAIVGLAVAAVLMLLGWLCYYWALEHGPVAVVGALAATYGAIAALLAVTVLGERLSGAAAAGIGIAVAGAVAAAAGRKAAISDPPGAGPESGWRRSRASRAIAAAGLSAVLYGLGAFWLAREAAPVGWLPAAVAAYMVSVVAVLVFAPTLSRSVRPGSSGGFMWAAVAGVAEALALAAFSRGGEIGQVAVTAAVSSIYPAIPLAAGLLLFRERPASRQLVGIGAIVTGLVIISLSLPPAVSPV